MKTRSVLGIVLTVLMAAMLTAVPVSANDSCQIITKELIGECPNPADGDFTTVHALFTEYTWVLLIRVENIYSFPITDVRISDNFGGEFSVSEKSRYSEGEGTLPPVYELSGASQKVHFSWYIGTLEPGEEAWIRLYVSTDVNPGGKQEFTSWDCVQMNSGAVLKWLDDEGHKQSAVTNPIVITITPEL